MCWLCRQRAKGDQIIHQPAWISRFRQGRFYGANTVVGVSLKNATDNSMFNILMNNVGDDSDKRSLSLLD